MHDTSHFSNNCLHTDYFTYHLFHCISQKFTYTKFSGPLNSLKNPENDVMALEASVRHHLSQLEMYLWMYFKAYFQTQCLFA